MTRYSQKVVDIFNALITKGDMEQAKEILAGITNDFDHRFGRLWMVNHVISTSRAIEALRLLEKLEKDILEYQSPILEFNIYFNYCWYYYRQEYTLEVAEKQLTYINKAGETIDTIDFVDADEQKFHRWLLLFARTIQHGLSNEQRIEMSKNGLELLKDIPENDFYLSQFLTCKTINMLWLSRYLLHNCEFSETYRQLKQTMEINILFREKFGYTSILFVEIYWMISII